MMNHLSLARDFAMPASMSLALASLRRPRGYRRRLGWRKDRHRLCRKKTLVPGRKLGHMSRLWAVAQFAGCERRRRMRLGYFTMPVHPMHRNWAETLKEDRAAIILADQLGFHDAFMGEHLTDACETITNSMMFLASLIPATRQIKLATGTSNL